MERDLYKLLGVVPTASMEEIYLAYKKLSTEYLDAITSGRSEIKVSNFTRKNIEVMRRLDGYDIVEPTPEEIAAGITEPKIFLVHSQDTKDEFSDRFQEIYYSYKILSDPDSRSMHDQFISMDADIQKLHSSLDRLKQANDRLLDSGIGDDDEAWIEFDEMLNRWNADATHVEQYQKDVFWQARPREFKEDQEAIKAAAEIQSGKGVELTGDRCSWRGDIDNSLIAFAEEHRGATVKAISRLTSKTQRRSVITDEIAAVATAISAEYVKQRNVSTPVRSEVGYAAIKTANEADPGEWIGNSSAVMAYFKQNVAGRF